MPLTAPLSTSPNEPVLDALPRDVTTAGSPSRRPRPKPTTPSTSCCSPSWSFRALRRFIAAAATHVPAKLSPHSHAHWVYLPSFAAPLGFRTPSTLLSAICLPALFRAGSVLGLPPFGGLLPNRSPSCLSASGVLLVVSPLARPRLRGCQHRSDALLSLHVISAGDARSSPGRSPLRGLTSTALPCASARLLSWASLVLGRTPPVSHCWARAPYDQFSSCSSEFHRSETATARDLRLSPSVGGSPSLGSLSRYRVDSQIGRAHV